MIRTTMVLLAMSAIAGAQPCGVDQGQQYIDQGRFDKAIREFSCVIDAQPTGVEGYRGRIEAELLSGQFSNAVRDYARVTAYVLPVHPDAEKIILAGYDARLAVAPNQISALTGQSFARWWFFDYVQGIHVLDRLLTVAPDNLYGNLFHGSCLLLSAPSKPEGVTDMDRAIALAPSSADVRYIVADAYTYGLHDAARGFAEASLALAWGLDTPRIHAILAVAYNAFGNLAAAAAQTRISIDEVTTQLISTAPLAAGTSVTLPLVPGRTYEVPLTVVAGERLSVSTGSRDFYDTILVLLAPDGTPVVGADDSVKYFAALDYMVGADDSVKYFAALDYMVGAAGAYRMRVTSFESVNTGNMVVSRK